MRKLKVLLGKEKEGLLDVAFILNQNNYDLFDIYDNIGDALEDTYRMERESINYYTKRLFEMMTDSDLTAYFNRIERYIPKRAFVTTSDPRIAKLFSAACDGDLIRVALYNADDSIPLEDEEYALSFTPGVSVGLLA